METIHLPALNKTAFVSLFKDIQNPGSILSRIQSASKLEGEEGDRERQRVNFAFVDAKLITSHTHLQTAIVQALLAAARDDLRTKTVHSEIIWSLDPSTNISDALRRFGVSKNTKGLLLVRVTDLTKDSAIAGKVEQSMKELIPGVIADLSELSTFTDWKEVRKVYRLNADSFVQAAEPEQVLIVKIDRIVSSIVATKGVQL